MTRALLICRRDLAALAAGPIVWALGAVFLLLAGWFFYTDLALFVLAGGDDVPRGLWLFVFLDLRLAVVLVLPLLAVRLLAAERRQGTLELLFTSPIGTGEIVAGKFLAALALYLALLLGTAVGPVVLRGLVPYAAGPVVAGYTGLFLFGAACIACALAAAAAVPSQAIAAGLTYGVLVLGWFLTWNEAALDDRLAPALLAVSLFDRFFRFATGTVELGDVIFFAGVTALLLLVARRALGSRPALRLAGEVLVAAALLAVALAAAGRHPLRLDLTPGRQNTLSPETLGVLATLREPARVTAFVARRDGEARRAAADLLGRYRDARSDLRVRLLDLAHDAAAAEALAVQADGTAVVEAGVRRESVASLDERALTAALRAVAGTPPQPAYFVVGHGERDPRETGPRGASEAARTLAATGLEARALEGAATVPADAGVVVLAGPGRALAEVERAGLAAHVARGGRLLVLADPGSAGDLGALLAPVGIELGADLVVDERGRPFGSDGRVARVAYVNQALLATPAVGGLLPGAQSLRVVDVGGVTNDYVATTTEDAWADVDRRDAVDGDPPFRDGRDRRGPVPLAAIAYPAGGGRVVVVGDADFASNRWLGVLGNRDLLRELVRLVTGTAAGVPAAPAMGAPMTLTASQAARVFWGGVVVPPALLALAALAAARRRRGA